MSDVAVETPTSKILQIPLKGKCGTVAVDPDRITDDAIYEYIFAVGLETVINKVGMSKKAAGITKLTGAAHESAVADVRKQAEDNVKAIYAGTIKRPGVSSKRSGAVQTEAMRLARGVVKQLLREEGYKTGAIDAKDLTAYAKEVLATNPELYKKAEANLAERAKEAETTKSGGIDIKALLGAKANDESLKAKPKVPPKPRAAKAKTPAAGAVAPRQKPAPHVTH